MLYEELVGPMVCWLEIELSLIESTYDVPALMFVKGQENLDLKFPACRAPKVPKVL